MEKDWIKIKIIKNLTTPGPGWKAIQLNLNQINKKSHNTRMEKEEKEEERKSRRAVARAATHNFMQVLYLCFCSLFVFSWLFFVYLLVLTSMVL